ncbi:MAG: class I SAM-dependent methyltransferase [Calditrichia bacterium]
MNSELIELVGDLTSLEAKGYSIKNESGIWSILQSDVANRILELEAALKLSRAKMDQQRIRDPQHFQDLPFGPGAGNHPEWRDRQIDLQQLTAELKDRSNLQILEIGAWNGWLCNNLVRLGHRVTALDYFSDDFDGLRAVKHYEQEWQCVQMNLAEPLIIKKQFDVIILNRCLAFFADPIGYIHTLKQLTKSNGILIATGLTFYYDALAQAKKIAERSADFKALYGTDMMLHPCRGFLDNTDMLRLEEAGMQLHSDRAWRIANTRSRMFLTRPLLRWGKITNDE